MSDADVVMVFVLSVSEEGSEDALHWNNTNNSSNRNNEYKASWRRKNKEKTKSKEQRGRGRGRGRYKAAYQEKSPTERTKQRCLTWNVKHTHAPLRDVKKKNKKQETKTKQNKTKGKNKEKNDIQ